MKNFVVTGAGRSGTMYVAKLFTAIGTGVDCGHEQIFNPWMENRLFHTGERIGESAWEAAPFIPKLPPGTIIFHQVRHPFRQIQSLKRQRFFEDKGEYYQFARRYCQQIDGKTLNDSYARYWICFNEMAALAETLGYEYHRYRIEDFNEDLCDQLAYAVGLCASKLRIRKAMELVRTDTNTCGDPAKDEPLTLDSFQEEWVKDKLSGLASQYGYQL